MPAPVKSLAQGHFGCVWWGTLKTGVCAITATCTASASPVSLGASSGASRFRNPPQCLSGRSRPIWANNRGVSCDFGRVRGDGRKRSESETEGGINRRVDCKVLQPQQALSDWLPWGHFCPLIGRWVAFLCPHRLLRGVPVLDFYSVPHAYGNAHNMGHEVRSFRALLLTSFIITIWTTRHHKCS